MVGRRSRNDRQTDRQTSRNDNKEREATDGVRTCVNSFVYLEVLGACKDLAAGWVRARERFLSGVNSYVVHQLVLGLERFAGTFTRSPVA